MSMECVAELRKFYDSQEVIEEEQRLREQKLKEAEKKKSQEIQSGRKSESSTDSIPPVDEEIEETITPEEDSGGMYGCM